MYGWMVGWMVGWLVSGLDGQAAEMQVYSEYDYNDDVDDHGDVDDVDIHLACTNKSKFSKQWNSKNCKGFCICWVLGKDVH